MTGPAAPSPAPAGRLESIRLAVRFAEPTADAGGGRVEEAPYGVGARRLGPLALEVGERRREGALDVDLRVRNAGDRPLRVDAVVAGFRWRDHGLGALRFLRHGWQSWSFTGSRDVDEAGEPAFPSGEWLRGFHHSLGSPPPDRRGWHESDLVTAVGVGPGSPALVAGVFERGRSFGIVYLRRAGDALDVEVELRLEALLEPGESRDLERIHLALGSDPSRLLERFAEAHGRAAGGRVSRPFVAGWCSWYWAFHEVTEDDLRRNLEALAASREEIPVEVVQLDDGYQRAVGDWLETNAKFPSGLAPLAAAIRDAGFVPGLWTAPFCVVPESALSAREDWLLRGPGGELLRGLLHPAWSANASVHVLDPSRPEVASHLEALFRALVGMGFLYLKLDFLYAAALEARAYDPGLGRAGRLRAGLEAIRRGAGEEAFLLGCGCPLGAAVGVVDGMRIGPDVAPTWNVAAGTEIPGLVPAQPSTRSALRSTLQRAFLHRRLWLNDPDCVLVRADSELTGDERLALAAVVAASGGLAFVSDDLARLGPEERALARNVIECARAVDGIGIPGAVRAPDPLAREIPDRLAARAPAARYELHLNTDDVPRRTGAAEGSPRLRLGVALSEVLPPHSAALVEHTPPFSLAVFCDFDGTFSVQDVGSTLAERHGGPRRPRAWARFERGEIRAWDYNLEVLDGLPVSVEMLEEFLRSVELDVGARALVDWCEERGVPFRVLSDGFDWNLDRLQALNGVRFAYAANRLRIERGRWRIAAGHPNPACACGTGTCKRGILESFRAAHPGARLVHIGNGRVSDTCGALAADLAFAKDSLALELERRSEPFEPFSTLYDVLPHLEKALLLAP